MDSENKIVIYQTEDNQTQVDVRLDDETVWLSLNHLVELFDRDKSVISRHIRNIYQEGELRRNSTVAKFATVQNEGGRAIERNIEFYNLDVIISVGYRVKSKRGTQFRIWANKILREYLVQGYSLNANLLKSQKEKISQLTEAINLFKSASNPEIQNTNEIDSFLRLLQSYSEALNLLDDYDYKRFSQIESMSGKLNKINYAEVKKIINKMKEEMGNSDLFGREKDESLKSSIEAIYQTFDGIDLYPTFFEKAANLLYFIVKNHSFVDGNKRIAAAVFLYFLNKNNYFEKHKLNNDLLTTLTLLIAISKPQDKDLLVNIVSVILQRNI
ncbi:MAG: hypothetical protein A2X64_01060 [Ignavibacteria bacterium GWF2_33_9]|nr:MAG: hypothetical protein A2X64_01060 [Ignavibacteria bacterium GWF2_33_9]